MLVKGITYKLKHYTVHCNESYFNRANATHFENSLENFSPEIVEGL